VSNKINGFDGSRPAAVGGGQVSQGVQSPAGGVPAASDSGSDSIHITDTASQLAALEQATRELPIVSDTRVAAVSSAIEQGTYSVSPQSIADNLMQMERSLG
jgi:negative regulator of flagellin synthesis FlgM